MIEKVNPSHPDKVADRIAGALVDLAYRQQENPKIAAEVLIGHGRCYIVAESSVPLKRYKKEVIAIVKRIAEDDKIKVYLTCVKQDRHLAKNQEAGLRCGDNGIFKGVPLTEEQEKIGFEARKIYASFPHDGKYIMDGEKFIVCQSHDRHTILSCWYPKATVNPLGYWTGGTSVDAGATNRKLGSDMADSITGGGLHGKDLSKADVSVNIYAFLKAQQTRQMVELCCAIGDAEIDGKPYAEIVETARQFINALGGFEKFAEWGLF